MNFIEKMIAKRGDAETFYQEAYTAETERKDIHKAFKLYERAAFKGLAKAQYYCGLLYLRGRGCSKKNYQKAILLLKEASEQDYPLAHYLLAQLYYTGEGVKENIEMGDSYMKKYNNHNISGKLTICFHSY